MQIVIDIPHQIYEASQILDVKYEDVIQIPLECIANGTPLPKGHGKLFDSEAYYADVKKHYFDNATVIRCTEIALNNAPTIIEADKTGSED